MICDGGTNAPYMGVRIRLLLQQDARRTETDNKKFLRSVLGYILHDHKTNEETRELNMCTLYGVIVKQRCRYAQHLLRMNDTSIPKLMYENIPTDRRNIGQPVKRWGDQHL
jgi:hypothetical protein